MNPTTSLLIVDDFLPDAQAVAFGARLGDFEAVEHDGLTYSGIGRHAPDTLVQALVEFIGSPVSVSHHFFRLTPLGQEPTSWVHADSGVGEMAAVLYLSGPDESLVSGTGFYRHGRSGAETLSAHIAARKASGEPVTDFDIAAELRKDANDVNAWKRTDFAAMKFNRLLLYPTDRFHAPLPFGGFGDGKESGRLIWACFFTPVQMPEVPPS